MYFLYNIILWLVLPLILVYHQYRSSSRGRPAAFGERFGFSSDSCLSKLTGARPIWVHAVSVGESVAVRPLLKAIKARYPNRPLVVSNMTETGRSVASGFPEVDCCIYFPFDFRFAVKRVIKAVNPAAIIVVETELWPNFLREARRHGVPTMIANGRISDRSFDGYKRASRFFRPVLENISRFCMQGDEDAKRIIAIGASDERVTVTRNLKLDIPAVTVSADKRAELGIIYGIPADTFVFTAASTHSGEDELVVEAYLNLLAFSADAFMVLVPRHPERAAGVAAMLAAKGFKFQLRSEILPGTQMSAGEVLLVDTVGELMKFYALSDLAFIGGSLVPTGGHNLLEPASMGIPMLYGPHMTNFREISSLVNRYEAGIEVVDGAALSENLITLFSNADRRKTMGANGIRLMNENGGATERHMAVLEGLLQGRA